MYSIVYMIMYFLKHILISHLTNILTRSFCFFQAMMQIIDALSTCVRHVGTFEEVPDLVTIRSLPACILKILRETFQHCKVGLFGSPVLLMATFMFKIIFWMETVKMQKGNEGERGVWLATKGAGQNLTSDCKNAV